ncbi:hypothetical protein ACIHDR_11525 [Nocardia sp. NPDC052278]|uniref:hypothetical protein n=1 Tax=unclassified Nocardia TaxID=2637762 RepID=UPI0036C3EAB3
MRIVSNRCATFEYAVTAKGPCAVEIAAPVIGVWRHFFDCLLLNINVEHGDRALPELAVRIVRSIVVATDARHIVVNGFVSLPEPGKIFCAPDRFDVLKELADALDVLTELVERLEERGERVHLMPFGWETSCHVDTPENQEAQCVIHLSVCPVNTGGDGREGTACSRGRAAHCPGVGFTAAGSPRPADENGSRVDRMPPGDRRSSSRHIGPSASDIGGRWAMLNFTADSPK